MLFFFNNTATTYIYTLSLHDALPISPIPRRRKYHSPRMKLLRSMRNCVGAGSFAPKSLKISPKIGTTRSEEHTSELQSHSDLVCRLLLEKKKNNKTNVIT